MVGMKIKIDIAKNCKSWNAHKSINKLLLADITKNVLSRFENFQAVKQFEISILLTDNHEMLKLNDTYRNNKKVTNVLSFPDINIDSSCVLEFKPNRDYMYLGDIAFSYQIIMDESKQQDKIFEHHFIHLFVHSVLHLIGFNHEDDKEAHYMEQLEVNILESLSIPSPYITNNH